MKNSFIDGQLSLFDLDFNMVEPVKPKKAEPRKSPVSTAQATIKKVVKKAESYLDKGNRILSLAREVFERKFKAKYDFSEFEKKVYTLNFDPLETNRGFIGIDFADLKLLKPIAAQFRRLLKSINELAAGDKAYDTLMELFKDSYEFEISESELIGYNVDSTDKAMESPVYKVSMQVGDGTLVCHGLKDVSHSKKHRNCIFASKGREAYHEGCTDLAYFFAFLYMASVVSKEIVKARQESTFFYEKNADLLNSGDISEILPKIYGPRVSPVFRENTFSSEEKALMEKILKKPIQTKEKVYRLQDNEWGISRSVYDCLVALQVPTNFFHSEESFIDPASIFTLKFAKEGKYGLPSYGAAIYLLYKLFLDIAEEKGAYIRESEYFKESGHVARAFETKKNIPEKTVKAMEESEFNEYFGYVEFDEDVDLEKVSEIAKEFIAFKETYLPGADVKDNQIRFRRLGKHKALGLYYPSLKCLCVDINAPSSLIHEFGHLLDYKYEELSSKFNFYAVRKRYEKVVDAAMGDNERWNGNTKYNKSYYLRPTEIFARSFEIYMSRFMGLKNSILETPGGYESFCYPSDEEYLNLVKNYFDEVLATINAKAEQAEVA